MASSQGLAAPDQWIKEAEDAYRSVAGYTATFHKQQRVDGELLEEETIFLKFRNPFSLYMKWVAEPYIGSELLYAQGWNNNRARVHRGGLLRVVTRNLEPQHPRLMANNLRPFTDVGLGYLVNSVSLNVRKAIKADELSMRSFGEETVYGRRTQNLEILFPRDKAKGYSAYRLHINQDVDNKMLIRIRIYDWDDQLFENYGYENLNLNAALTDTDFSPNCAGYHF